MASMASLEQSLRDTLKKEAAESERRRKAAQIQQQAWDQHRLLTVPLPTLQAQVNEEQLAKSAVATARAKELEIERRKQEVKVKVQAQLDRVEQEARRLDELRRELECLEDPTKKEVAEIRKKIENVDRELRPLKQMCDKKEKELKETVEAYNEKSKLKTQLVTKLMEIVTESERLRMNKLDELNRHLEIMGRQDTTIESLLQESNIFVRAIRP